MKTLLLTIDGRITRSQYFLALLIFVGISLATAMVVSVLSWFFPGVVDQNGGVTVTGPAAIPYVILGLAYFAFNVWSGVCVNAKRCHDRGRSGWFMLVQLIPLIGVVWYFIEILFLRGTVGPNRFGPDPLAEAPGMNPGAARTS